MTDTTQVVERSQSAMAQRQQDKAAPTVTLLPAVDIVEDSSGVTLWADLPGVTRDKLQVSVHDGNLHIEAEAVVPTPSGLRVQHAEIHRPHFARVLVESGSGLNADRRTVAGWRAEADHPAPRGSASAAHCHQRSVGPFGENGARQGRPRQAPYAGMAYDACRFNDCHRQSGA